MTYAELYDHLHEAAAETVNECEQEIMEGDYFPEDDELRERWRIDSIVAGLRARAEA